MDRVWRALTAGAAALVLGAGCTGMKMWKAKDEPSKVPPGVPTAPLKLGVMTEPSPIVQASAVTPGGPAAGPSLAKLTGMGKPAKVTAVAITTAWRNRIEYLPDPSRNGEMGAGLAGQMFLFDARDHPAPAEGKLIVALYDETPRPPDRATKPPEGWEFDAATLKQLRTTDERFGPCYALFLPWPSYTPDVTRVRIAVRFEPEHGHKLYADESRISIDTSVPGSGDSAVTSWTQPGGFGSQPGTFGPPAGSGAPGQLPPGLSQPALPIGKSPFGSAGAVVPPTGDFGPLPPQPGGPVAPAGLPPLAIIASPGGK